MTIQIYGFPFSVSVRRVLVALKELDVPYELVNVDVTKGENRAPEVLAVQPFGQIPYLRDTEDDFTLYESRAIARYIVDKYDKDGKSGLIPKGLKAAAKFEQAVSVELTKYDPHVMELAFELYVKPSFFKQEPDEAAVTKHRTALEKTLDVYENVLKKQKYLAGDSITLADLFHLPLGTLLIESAQFDILTIDQRPNVQRWWKDMSSRPAWDVVKADNSPFP
ncbi:hypothetical protein EIP91_007357 [Steccherinum ochraceum]|uniref:glutathione transferase n=1 Tax=Steccherinum ochraceum TaxID=92696 RepID=A0A4R0RRS2_9APHY|nr:hypothetical protein EIP91_007357 [Steccherinum ochraceum]